MRAYIQIALYDLYDELKMPVELRKLIKRMTSQLASVWND